MFRFNQTFETHKLPDLRRAHKHTTKIFLFTFESTVYLQEVTYGSQAEQKPFSLIPYNLLTCNNTLIVSPGYDLEHNMLLPVA
jgi:hypothetical protein